MSVATRDDARRLASLGIVVLQRGWLSANNILFLPPDGAPATVVDTGYASHAEQTESLIRAGLAGRSLGRVVNTHLHSDHCGGNARLQQQFGCETWVPEASLEAVRRWDEQALSFVRTDQRCEPFAAHRGIEPGAPIELGGREWIALSTPGHDPNALVFFEPESEVLISGDALWEDRLAIVFPELAGDDGFSGVRDALHTIETLKPRLVIPGHGAPFSDVGAAVATSRHRLAAFERMPERHLAYALRALAMFHMLEHRERTLAELAAWMARTPILRLAMQSHGVAAERVGDIVGETIDRLLRDGALGRRGEVLHPATERRG